MRSRESLLRLHRFRTDDVRRQVADMDMMIQDLMRKHDELDQHVKVEEAKKHLDDKEAAELKAATEALQSATHKLTEEMYKKAAQAAGKDGATGANGAQAGASAAGNGDDVVDADFEEVSRDS